MSTSTSGTHQEEAAQLEALGYKSTYSRSMSLWGNIALGFTYLSPLVAIYALFAVAVSTGGPPSIWWIVIVGGGQLLVALVFGEIVSQFPIAGGLYPWARRLWGKRYAWIISWIYVWAMIVTITSVIEFSTGYATEIFGVEYNPLTQLLFAVGILVLALVLNLFGTRTMSIIARIGLAAELIGVVGVGLYLLIFQRHNDWSVFFDTFGKGDGGNYIGTAFVAAALVGLFMFYGFEACGDVAEEVKDAARRVPRAMYLTIFVGGVSALFSFAGYVMAAPNLASIVNGDDMNPIPGILESALGPVGAKIFLGVAVLAFISCTLSLQAAASRLIQSKARDGMLPASKWLAKLTPRTQVPRNALLVASIIPIILTIVIYVLPDSLVPITQFAVLGIYVSFQSVVLASLIQRFRGWKPAGPFHLGAWGIVVNIAALIYGIWAIVWMLQPGATGNWVVDWASWLGLGVVLVAGVLYMLIARPAGKSNAPAGDAIAVANMMRAKAAAK
jgi:amino acid transporter